LKLLTENKLEYSVRINKDYCFNQVFSFFKDKINKIMIWSSTPL